MNKNVRVEDQVMPRENSLAKRTKEEPLIKEKRKNFIHQVYLSLVHKSSQVTSFFSKSF